MTDRNEQKQNRLLFGSGLFLISIFILSIVARAFISSLFWSKKDRINLVFYGSKAHVYSLGSSDDINYIINYYPDLKILIPGGYQYYRVGALGKLIYLEKKPELFIRAFSSSTSTLTHFYFYNKGDSIYFGQETSDDIDFPSFNQIFLSKSNANIFDRIYIFRRFLAAKKTEFNPISNFPKTKEGKEAKLDEDAFYKNYLGFFYQKTYRNEKRTVQILYSKSYNSAALISRILEGSGVRVVDISEKEIDTKKCQIIEHAQNFSKTARDLASFFNCQLKKGNPPVSDIIIELGPLEENWAW